MRYHYRKLVRDFIWPCNIVFFFSFGEYSYWTNINFANDDDQISRRHQNVPMRVFYAYLIYEREYGEYAITKDDCLYQ